MENNMTKMPDAYRTILRDGEGEIVEKKSRFLAKIHAVDTEEEALAYIEQIKKQYWDARHNCYAYIIGRNSECVRCSDDGEPSGTAGRPMLEVLQNEQLKNVVVVVTRYFGGVLLGTGGLVRAYTQAVLEGLRNASAGTMQLVDILQIDTDYPAIGKIKYTLGENNIAIQNEEYTQMVRLQAAVPVALRERIMKELTETTNGKVKMEVKEQLYLGKMD